MKAWKLLLLILLLPMTAHAVGFRIASGDDDYVVRGGGSTWPPAFSSCNTNFTLSGTPSVLTQAIGFVTDFTVDEMLLKWDTSAIPAGATITAATLTVKVSYINVTNQTLNGDWYNWDGGCDASDFTTTTPSGAFAAVDPSGWTLGSLRTITLTNLSNIATGPGAVTFLRLSMSLASVATQAANGVGIVDFAGDQANAALLDVTYAQFSPTPTIPSPTPTLTPTPTSGTTPTRLPTNTSVPGGNPTFTPVPRCGEALPQ